MLLAGLPRSGPAYDAVVSAANNSTRPDLANQDSKGNTNALARALLARDISADITAMKGSLPNVSRTLSLARELAPMPLVSALGGRGTSDCSFYQSAINRTGLEGRDASSVRESARIDPTNWGSMARAAVMAVAWLCGDEALRDEAYNNVYRYLDGGWTGFRYKPDQISWGTWTVAPKGTVKSSFDLDGAIHDIYRGGAFPTVGADGVNYVWEASQGNVVAAIFADMAGYPEVWQVGDRALLRSIEWMYRTDGIGGPTGDDRWQSWIIERAYGAVFSRTLETPTTPGKNFGWTDWLYGS